MGKRFVAVLLGLLVLIPGCSVGKKPPLLENVYQTKLSDYWAQMAAYVGIEPSLGRLHDWQVTYDGDGKVSSLKIGFITGAPGFDDVYWYTIHQDARGGTKLRRTKLTTEGKDFIWAERFFSELDEVGPRRLAENGKVTPPVEMKLNTVYTDRSDYDGLGYAIKDGQIVPTAVEPITQTGGQGMLLVLPADYSGSGDPYTYFIPSTNIP